MPLVLFLSDDNANIQDVNFLQYYIMCIIRYTDVTWGTFYTGLQNFPYLAGKQGE